MGQDRRWPKIAAWPKMAVWSNIEVWPKITVLLKITVQDHGVRQYTALSASFTGPESPDSGVAPTPTPLVLLHGFTQTGASWAPIVAELQGRGPIIVPDAARPWGVVSGEGGPMAYG